MSALPLIGPIMQGIGGVAAHVQGMAGEMSPAAVAQRKEFKKARDQLQVGNFGYSEAQKQQAGMSGAQQIAAQQAGVQADLARQQAAGNLSGGGATDARRALYQEALAANAQNASNVQAASNAKAQNDYAAAQGRVDAQADRARAFWANQAKISQDTTNAMAASMPGAGGMGGGEDPTKGDELFGRKATPATSGATK